MSDHIDGPRSIGDPAIDVTDLYVFTSPENAERIVLVANVFPSAGANAMFSNVVNHSIIVRRATVAGLGDAAKFQTGDEEYRFSCRLDALEPGREGAMPVQRGTCTLPGGQVQRFVVNDEKGVATPDGVFRVFAGLRSDPFFLGWLWLPTELKKFPNLLQHDNVLSIVIEFDARRVLNPNGGSLFAVVAETSPLPRSSDFSRPPSRFDWIGRPEQTNMRLNNPAVTGTGDVRDLWNQQTPFAIAKELEPVFRKRLLDSLADFDMRDGKADWTPAALAASANVFLDDFLLFDLAKPMTDASFLEIEKSTLHGHAYQTGGGRTLDANVIDILMTWMVNHDQGEFMQGGATGATRPGGKAFPYLAPPNTQLQTVAESVDLSAPPDQVWALIGSFGGMWHPLIAKIQVMGTGVGQLRTIETIDGKQVIERLEVVDNSQRRYRYVMISGIPAADYTGTLDVKPKGPGSSVEWRVEYLADGQPDVIVKTIVSSLLRTGLESLKPRFGVPQ